MNSDPSVVDRRSSPEFTERRDRRKFTWRTVFYGFILSRRRAHRREEDEAVVFLDWHHPWLFFLSVSTMLMSCADAYLTLQLLEKGMIETNPVMLVVMSYGTAAFVSAKMTMTALAIFVFVYLAKARFMDRFRSGVFLTLIFGAYACLVCFELVSLFDLL